MYTITSAVRGLTASRGIFINKALALAELGKFDDAVIAANNGVRLAPEGNAYARALIARAKIYHLAGRPVDAAGDVLAAWKLNPDLVIASEECRDIYTEAYRSIDSPSGKLSLLYGKFVAGSNEAEADTRYALTSAD